MQPIHLAIGLVEGLITAAVLCFVYEARPELLWGTDEGVEKITFFLIQMDVRSSSPEYRLIISVLQGRDGEIRSMTGSI